MSDDDLTENEINQKSTSDRTKRRVAHVPKYTIPVTKKTISPTKKQEDPEQKYQKQIRPVTNNLKTVQVCTISYTIYYYYSDKYFFFENYQYV